MIEVPEVCAIVIDELVEQRHNKEMTQADLAKASELIQSVIARFDIFENPGFNSTPISLNLSMISFESLYCLH